MGFRAWVTAGMVALSLIGCGSPAIAPVPLAAMVDAQGANVSEDDVFKLVRLIADETGIDASKLDPAKLRKINQNLVKDRTLREKTYQTSDTIIDRWFNRPDKGDSVPRLSAQDMQVFKSKLQPGDVIQCGNDGSFIHGIFYVGQDTIIHALAEPMNGKRMIGVVKESLTDYFERVERDQVVVLRPRWTAAQLKTATAYAEAQVGKGYDSLFLTESSDRFYCTELVYKALTTAKVARIQPHVVKESWPVVMNEDLRQSPDLKVVYAKNHD